jgi:hypothetical protein
MLLMFSIGAIIGILFGLHFKVLILVPAVIGIALVIVVLGTIDGHLFPATLRAVGIVAVAIQLGYAAGCVFQLVSLRLARQHPTQSETTRKLL